jgi:DNA-directed RNA polymerase specialized sigma24 family protein
MNDQVSKAESLFPNTDSRIRPPDSDPDFGWQRLIDAYRVPIERCLRRHLQSVDQTVVDDFFFYLYSGSSLQRYDKEKQRFRAFIQGVAKNFAREYRRTLSRGGSIGDVGALELAADPGGGAEHEVDDREWAKSVFEQAFSVLRAERPMDSQLLVNSFGLFGRESTPRAELAKRLGRSTGALNVAVHVAKRRLGELIELQLRNQCPDTEAFLDDKRMMLQWIRDAAPLTETNSTDGG